MTNKKNNKPQISLKKAEEKDLPYIRKLWADEKTMADVGGVVLMDEEKMLNWHRKIEASETTDYYRLILNQQGEIVGEVSFHRYNEADKSAHMNIKIEHSHRGMGYSKTALAEILRYFFTEKHGEMMLDDVREENIKAIKFLLASGFEMSSGQPLPNTVRLFMSKKMYEKKFLRHK